MGLAAAGILLLGGAAVAFILLQDGGDSPVAGGSAARAPEAPPTPGRPLPPLPGQAALPPPPPPPEPVVFEEQPPAPAEDAWESTPAAPRPAGLGAIGPAVAAELAALQPRIYACFDEDIQARHGTEPVSRLPDGRGREESGATLLVLHLEVSPGQVRIVDAPVESQGAASDGLVACAQGILRDRVVRTPAARASARARLVLPLNP